MYARATLNCPWSGDLWAGRLRAHERLRQEAAAVDELYHAALAAVGAVVAEAVKVHLAWIDYQRRRPGGDAAAGLRPIFERARARTVLSATPSLHRREAGRMSSQGIPIHRPWTVGGGNWP